MMLGGLAGGLFQRVSRARSGAPSSALALPGSSCWSAGSPPRSPPRAASRRPRGWAGSRRPWPWGCSPCRCCSRSIGRSCAGGSDEDPPRRTGVAGVVLVLLMSLFGLLVARLGQVQLVQGAPLTSQAAWVHTRTITEHALRGQILDRTGDQLLTNAFSTVVTVERAVLLDADDGGRALVRSVAGVLDQPFDRLWGKTMLCGTVGAPRAPACFNGSPYVPIPIATGRRPAAGADGHGATREVPRHRPHPRTGPQLPRHPRGPTRPTCSAGSPGPVPTTSRPATRRSTTRTSSAGRGSRRSTTPSCGVTTEQPSSRSTPGGSSPRRCRAATPCPGPTSSRTSTPDCRLAPRRCSPRRWPTPGPTDCAPSRSSGRPRRHQRGGRRGGEHPAYDPGVFTGGISSGGLEALRDPSRGAPLKSRITTETFPPASTFKVISVPAAVASGANLKGTYDCSPSFTVGGRVFKNFESRGYRRSTCTRRSSSRATPSSTAWRMPRGRPRGARRAARGHGPLHGDHPRLRHRSRNGDRPAGGGGRAHSRPGLEGAVLGRDAGGDLPARLQRLPRGRRTRPEPPT